MSLLPNMVCVCVFKNAVGCLEGGKSVLKGFRCEVMSVSSQYKMNNVTRKSPLSSSLVEPVCRLSHLYKHRWNHSLKRLKIHTSYFRFLVKKFFFKYLESLLKTEFCSIQIKLISSDISLDSQQPLPLESFNRPQQRITNNADWGAVLLGEISLWLSLSASSSLCHRKLSRPLSFLDYPSGNENNGFTWYGWMPGPVPWPCFDLSRWGCCPLHSALPGLHCLVCLRHPHLLRYVTRRCDVHTSFLPHSPPLSSPTVFFLHCLTANRTMLRKSRGPLLLIMVSLEPGTVPAM